MKLRLPLKNKSYVTLLSVYAPTMTNDTQTKMDFYAALGQALQVPKTDKLMVLGGLQRSCWRRQQQLGRALGPHGRGKANSIGHLLLELCTEHDLAITNTFFEMPDKWFNSWQHPGQKTGISSTTYWSVRLT